MVNKYDFKFIFRRVLTYFTISIILFCFHSCTASATIERVPPSVSYQQPTNTIFNNRVISDQHYWGIDINNLGNSNSLVWHYNYAPRYGDKVLYNYTFFLYSSYDSLNINMNGRACYSIASQEQSTATGNQSRTNTKFMVYCPNIPYSNGLDIGMYNEIVNTWGNVWTIGLSWDFDVQPMNVNDVASAVNDVNNSINNDSVDTNSANNTFNDLNNNMASSSVISDLLLMPVNFINKVLDGANNSCNTYHVGELWGDSFDLPCINGADYVGATLWNVIDCIGAGMLAFMIGKRMVRIFNDLTNLKDGGLDSAYD